MSCLFCTEKAACQITLVTHYALDERFMDTLTTVVRHNFHNFGVVKQMDVMAPNGGVHTATIFLRLKIVVATAV